MARTAKNGIDYFPFDVDFFSDIKVRRIKKDCGAASVSVLIFLLCLIYRDDGYYISLNEDLPFVVAESTGAAEGLVQETINKAVKVGFFDAVMLDRHKVLTSRGIQRRYINAIKASKLKRDEIDARLNLLESSEEIEESSEEKPKSSEENAKSSEESTQRTVKDSKEKDSKKHIVLFWESVWKLYPEKKGKGQVSDTQKKKLYDVGLDELSRCIERYKRDKPDWKKYQHGSTFFNSGYIDYLDANYSGEATGGESPPATLTTATGRVIQD